MFPVISYSKFKQIFAENGGHPLDFRGFKMPSFISRARVVPASWKSWSIEKQGSEKDVFRQKCCKVLKNCLETLA